MMNLLLEMTLDLDVARHKREIAAGFAALRARLGVREPTDLFLRQQNWANSIQNVGMAHNPYCGAYNNAMVSQFPSVWTGGFTYI